MSSERAKQGRRSSPLGWVLAAVALLVGYTLCRRGIVLSDEGYLLYQALEMADGKVPYRDLDSFVAPGVWFLLSWLFAVFEPSVMLARLAALACWGATLWLAWRITARLAGAPAAHGAVVALLFFTVWAFPAWTWSFYSPYAVLFALAALERLLAWRDSGRGADVFLAGIWLGCATLFKQNYGALALAGSALAVVAIRLEAGSAGPRKLADAGLRLGAGVALVGLPAVGYFAAHGALADAFRALVLHPFGDFLGHHGIPYLPPSELFRRELMEDLGRYTYGAFAYNHTAGRFRWPALLVRGIEILHVLLYWIPPLVLAMGAVLARRGRGSRRFDAGLASAVCVAGMLFLGVFPRADFNHLVHVYQPVIVVGAVVVQRLAERGVRAAGLPLRAFATTGIALLVLYAGVAAYWYVDLLRTLDAEVPGRGGVLVDALTQPMLEFEVNAIQAGTRPGEAVLTLPGLAMLNFLAERPMPSRYANLYAVHIAHDGGRGVVEGSERVGLRLVVADYWDFFSERARVRLRDYAPELVDYLRRHFAPAFSVGLDERLFLRRRAQPLPERETLDALADCDVGRFDRRARGVAQHLLFATLYHPLVVDGELLRRQSSTLCRVQVPEAGVLSFAAGYRQPTRVGPGATLQGQIWLKREGDSAPGRLIWRETFELVPVTGWASPPPQEVRLDLSAWGGDDVLLLFRTRYRGDVVMQPADLKGFAMFWQDVRIEFEGSRG